MTELDRLIDHAYKYKTTPHINQVYLAFLKTKLFIPITRNTHPEEPFSPLFAKLDNNIFISVFDSYDRLTFWLGKEKENVEYVELLGTDMIRGINSHIYLALNPGCTFYKEFSPEEIQHLKKIILKLDSFKSN